MNTSQLLEAETVTERTIKDLTTIGRAWARYGLTVGKSALETSAVTLQKTASLLGDLSSLVQEKKEPPTEESAPAPDNKPS